MKRRILTVSLVLCCLVLLDASGQKTARGTPEPPGAMPASGQRLSGSPAATVPAISDFGRMPLDFIPNQGQLDPRVAYYVQGKDTSLYFTAEGLTFLMSRFEAANGGTRRLATGGGIPADAAPDSGNGAPGHYVVKLDFVGGDPGVKPVGLDETGAVISYFTGRPDEWRAGLPTYSKVIYPNLWPGIDLVYYGTVNRLKYEFVVRPGADPSRIRLAYRGVEKLTVNEAGQLEVATPAGSFRDDVPVAYQEVDSQRMAIPLRYAIAKESIQDSPRQTDTADAVFSNPKAGPEAEACGFGFEVGEYDKTRPLVLDPAILVYSGYIGGVAAETGFGICRGRVRQRVHRGRDAEHPNDLPRGRRTGLES